MTNPIDRALSRLMDEAEQDDPFSHGDTPGIGIAVEDLPWRTTVGLGEGCPHGCTNPDCAGCSGARSES